jgi:hypothetical protein
VKDQPLGTINDVIAEIAGIPIEELAKEPTEDGRHLISVDELRAAGALDVPAEWRKSLGGERRFTLPGFDDDETADSQADTQHDSESDAD